ncbi:kinase-like protein [Dentipellis sp. KUC8613]|nr:kinase-like protein [Dentipellis sp. KUC8613]
MASILDDIHPGSPITALVPLEPDWRPILHVSNQIVLYNPTSHAVTIHRAKVSPARPPRLCPYCARPLPTDAEEDYDRDEFEDNDARRDANYFQLLEVVNETASRPSSPPMLGDEGMPTRREESRDGRSKGFKKESMAEGYFEAFFREEARLGMGANGSVFLCQHVLNDNPLGHFAVKKIAVGDSSSYLLQILREVRLLESLRHPNIITYHHAWLETAQFSSFGPKVPTLHVLMQWAEGGSLDDYIDARLGRDTSHPVPHIHPVSPSASPSPAPDSHQHPSASPSPAQADMHSRTARIRAFRAMQHADSAEKARIRERLRMGGAASSGAGAGAGASARSRGAWKAVHLLSAEEVKALFGDIVEGLAFLHDKSILHLDLKPGNVLLTWDEGKLVPRAMLSDFGTSRDMIHSTRARSGNTGTLEYTSPESLPSPLTGKLQQIDSKADMWSLGMILHKLLFFRLPYRWAADGDRDENVPELAENGDERGRGTPKNEMDKLEREVLEYKGFKSTRALETAFKSRRLPRAFLILLESLLNTTPSARPSAEKILNALHEGKFNPTTPGPHSPSPSATSSLGAHPSSSLVVPVPVPRRTSPPLLGPSPSPTHRTMLFPHLRAGPEPSDSSSASTEANPVPPASLPPDSSRVVEIEDKDADAGGGAGGETEVEVEETETETDEEKSASWEAERAALLGLAAPDAAGGWRRWCWAVARAGVRRVRAVGKGDRRAVVRHGHGHGHGGRRGRLGRYAPVVGRAARSCVLAAKVASLMLPGVRAQLHPSALGMLLVLGVLDSVVDWGWEVSLGLVALHLVVLRAVGGI